MKFGSKTQKARGILYNAKRVGKQKRNYNAESWGDGSVLDAIKHSIRAYQQKQWNEVATADDLKPDAILDRTLFFTDRTHYNLSVGAANAIAAAPTGIKNFNNRYPIGFNKSAKHKPPNKKRDEYIGEAGVHMFYGFKKGREYQ